MHFTGLITHQRVSLWISNNVRLRKVFFETRKKRANFGFQTKLKKLLMYSKFADYLEIFNGDIQLTIFKY